MPDETDQTEETDTAQGGEVDDTDNAASDDALGDAGKQALDRMKARWQAERDKRKVAEEALAGLSAKPDEAADAIKTARDEATREVRASLLRERALDRVEVLAAKAFSDPADARHFLAGSVEEFVDGDKVDVVSIQDALDELLKAKPYLAVSDGKRFKGGADNGMRGNGQPPSVDHQIAEAQAKGDWRTVMRLQNSKLPRPSA